MNSDFWREIAPGLTICQDNPGTSPVSFGDDTLKDISARFHDEGYLHLDPVFERAELAPLGDGIVALKEAGFPPVFIYLFDQPYALFARLAPLIDHFLGGRFALLPNFWAWNIPLESGARGWPPHQDCQAKTRFPDGAGGEILMSLSLWVPLTDATTDNGCMSVLPRSREHKYDLPLDDPDGIDPVDGVPLPTGAGSVLGWPQDLYHWSNRVTEQADTPRVSLSLEFQNTAFDPLAKPLLDVFVPPSFESRLNLIQQQFSKYRHMEDTGFLDDESCDKTDVIR
jgi:hypothetical protein